MRAVQTHRLNEVTCFSVTFATCDDGRTFLLAALDVIHHSVVLCLRDDWTLVACGCEGVSTSTLVDRASTDIDTYPTVSLEVCSLNI